MVSRFHSFKNVLDGTNLWLFKLKIYVLFLLKFSFLVSVSFLLRDHFLYTYFSSFCHKCTMSLILTPNTNVNEKR